MKTEIKRELLNYFESIHKKSQKEKLFYLYLKNEVDMFDVVRISRENIFELGYNGANITDEEMGEIANNILCDDCISKIFVDALTKKIHELHINKLQK